MEGRTLAEVYMPPRSWVKYEYLWFRRLPARGQSDAVDFRIQGADSLQFCREVRSFEFVTCYFFYKNSRANSSWVSRRDKLQ
jgi:hypothetical protein